ncbi:MAG: HemK2/MTQ2 family protein methyltransferase [Candidatus Lutacidiplasmatales archaeon]
MTRVARPPGVYPFREDSALLLPFAHVPAGSWLLEIGCGEGRAALEAARGGARVVATDLNPEALRRLELEARRSGLWLAPVRTDLARGLGRFDRVLANPPYLPTPEGARDPDRWENLALDGGTDGCAVTARVLESLGEHLSPGGEGFVVVSSRQSPARLDELHRDWLASGGSLEVASSERLGSETLDVWRLSMALGVA